MTTVEFREQLLLIYGINGSSLLVKNNNYSVLTLINVLYNSVKRRLSIDINLFQKSQLLSSDAVNFYVSFNVLKMFNFDSLLVNHAVCVLKNANVITFKINEGEEVN